MTSKQLHIYFLFASHISVWIPCFLVHVLVFPSLFPLSVILIHAGYTAISVGQMKASFFILLSPFLSPSSLVSLPPTSPVLSLGWPL